MTLLRGLLIVMLVSGAAAAVVGAASRTPAPVRAAAQDGSADADLGASFTEQQVARHGAYRAPLYLGTLLMLIVEVVALVVLARGVFGAIIDHAPAAWPLRALAGGAVAAASLWLAALPLAYVQGFVIRHAWGLSTQSLGGWLSDVGKGLMLSVVFTAIGALAFYAVIRWQPRAWWLVGWATFTILNALIVYLFPVVIAPLFNRFTPVEPALAQRVQALASEIGVDVDEVLVADASRRTTAENAYVAGLGSTRRVVLDDTLLEGNDEAQTMFVVAHELAHEAERHVLKGIALSSAGLLAGFLVLSWLAQRGGVWAWAGGGGIGDVRTLPVLMLAVLILTTLLTPAATAVSRRFEARADRIAFEVIDDRAPAVSAFRRLAFSNLADLRPPRALVTLLFSHPPIPERIAAAVAVTSRAP